MEKEMEKEAIWMEERYEKMKKRIKKAKEVMTMVLFLCTFIAGSLILSATLLLIILGTVKLTIKIAF